MTLCPSCGLTSDISTALKNVAFSYLARSTFQASDLKISDASVYFKFKSDYRATAKELFIPSMPLMGKVEFPEVSVPPEPELYNLTVILLWKGDYAKLCFPVY